MVNTLKSENTHGLGKYMATLMATVLNYMNAMKGTILHLWQYLEFRILVFIFASASCIPLALFLAFCTCWTCLTLIFSASVWLIFNTIALIVLFPFLIGSMGVAIGLVLVYQVCVIMNVYLALIFNSPANDENDDDLVTCDDDDKKK